MGDIILSAVTVPDDLPHKSRAEELRELPSFITVNAGGITDTFTDVDGNLFTIVNGIIQAKTTGSGTGLPFMPSQAISAPTGTSMTFQCAATNTPTSWAASNLPTGLSINGSTGLISGTPTLAGIFTSTIFATNDVGTGQATITFTISPP